MAALPLSPAVHFATRSRVALRTVDAACDAATAADAARIVRALLGLTDARLKVRFPLLCRRFGPSTVRRRLLRSLCQRFGTEPVRAAAEGLAAYRRPPPPTAAADAAERAAIRAAIVKYARTGRKPAILNA